MTTTTQRARDWQGPAIFSFGFRPFFLAASGWAVVAMVIWVTALAGAIELPTRFDPITWHVHEFLFGYLGAVTAGFLLTAVPNWTGRLPVIGWPLAALSGLWLAGRLAIMVSGYLPTGLAALIDLGFPLALTMFLLREIIAGKNWRNLIVLAMMTVFGIANAVYHIEAAFDGYGARMGIAAGIMMISVIGGRIIPSFTRNWLVKRGITQLPTPPMQWFDRLTLLATVAGLVSWVFAPTNVGVAGGLGILGAMHLLRLARWQGHRTTAEPLVLVLHLAYAFVPIGAFAMAMSIFWPAILPPQAALHIWTAGAIGLMTLAVMTRATLGHTGQVLHARKATVAIYATLLVAVGMRLVGQMHMAGAAWITAFALFCLVYGPLLLQPAPKR